MQRQESTSESGLSTSFKLYFSVEKLQILMQ